MSKSRDQVITYLKNIDIEGKKVIDVGAGPSEWWAKAFTKGTPLEYDTVDINPEYGCTFNWDLNCSLPDDHKTYDIVFCMETLEHIWNPIVAIMNLQHLTSYGGTLYISTPFINPLHDTHDFLRYTIQWYEHVLPLFGFHSIKVTPRIAMGVNIHEDKNTMTNALDDFYKAESMRMSKITQEQGYGSNLLDVGYIVECHK